MKNKLSILLLTGAFLTLGVGCNKTAASNTSDSTNNGTSQKADSSTKKDSASNKESDDVISSDDGDDDDDNSSTSVETYIPELSEFLDHFAKHNVTITNTYYKLDFYGDNALAWTSTGKNSKFASTSNFKQVAVGEDGVWSWTTDTDGKFVLDQMVSPIKIYDDMTVLYGDYYDAIDSFGESEDDWVAGTKDGVYTIDDDSDSGVTTAIPALASYFVGETHAVLGSITSITTSNIKMTIKNQFSATVSFSARIEGKKSGTLTSSFTVSKAGENTVEGLDDFVEDPSSYISATDFNDTVKAAMTEVLGATLDFNVGWTRGWQYSVGTDSFSGKQTEISYNDLMSGDITTALDASLVAAGYTAGETTTSDYGYEIHTYTKKVADATTTTGDKIATIQFAYIEKSLFSSPAYYPNGMMQMVAYYDYDYIYGLDKVNTFLAAKPLKKDGTAALPQLDLASYSLADEDVILGDLTISANTSGQFDNALEGYYIIDIHFASADDALTAMNAYIASMKDVKFKINGTDTLEEKGTASYKLTNNAFSNKLNLSITLYNTSTSSTTDPNGGAQITFYY